VGFQHRCSSSRADIRRHVTRRQNDWDATCDDCVSGSVHRFARQTHIQDRDIEFFAGAHLQSLRQGRRAAHNLASELIQHVFQCHQQHRLVLRGEDAKPLNRLPEDTLQVISPTTTVTARQLPTLQKMV
jgi:hypothetical protein